MSELNGVSRRGVYYDLALSPFVYMMPNGDILKFSSKKKLEIYARDIPREIKRMEAFIERHRLIGVLPDETINLLIHSMYRAFYKKIEG